MKKLFFSLLIPVLLLQICGCVPLIIGGAAGALGAVAISKDTIQGDSDKPYDSLWEAACVVAKIRGTVKQEDASKGYIELAVEAGKVEIRLIRLTRATTRIRIKSRKHHLPNLALAEELYTKILEEAR